ncbi:MAG: single-stranded-DNA-specific exonuclease RecJ, partial [Burkholderiales bacterium]|nr:single-stranded-DNA-specific exonuclease RecJ [Burkholderiales bacterium]
SKHLAGVGVIFYLMLSLRAELRQRAIFDANGRPEPNLAELLDIVALGTVADVVRLDDNNRRLVGQGLARIRAGRTCAGIRALMHVAARELNKASAYDLGFVLGPRLNAAGRLADMSLGIECLVTDDDARAAEIARQLDSLNSERRQIEAGMQETALARLDGVDPHDNFTLCLFEPDWHQGVIGILASRLKDRFHRPAIAFARGESGTLKGSGRSIAALHLRDALDLVAKRHPGLIAKFGGHAAAAGLTISETSLPAFAAAFEAVSRLLLSATDLTQRWETDGELVADEITVELAEMIQKLVWGQGFPAPRFEGVFEIEDQRVVAEKHLKLTIRMQELTIDAINFFCESRFPTKARLVYRPEVNEFNGQRRVQLVIEQWEAA